MPGASFCPILPRPPGNRQPSRHRTASLRLPGAAAKIKKKAFAIAAHLLEVSADDLGGATTNAATSGVAHLAADSEEECLALVREHPPRRQERQMAGVNEHHQGSAEGRAGIQVSEVGAGSQPRKNGRRR